MPIVRGTTHDRPLSVNLIGGPSMPFEELSKWSQKTYSGPVSSWRGSGQYDPTKLVNCGSNRWAFKPELGYSRRWGHWIVDAYGGAWFYTINSEIFSHNQFSPGVDTQS
jgi:hypothetical protein